MKRAFLIIGVFVLAGGWNVRGAAITWTAPFNLTSDSDVSTLGTLVYAETWGTGATVNGITFTTDTSDTGSANVKIAFSQPGVTSSNVGANAAPFTNLSTAYRHLLTGCVYGGSSGTVTLQKLTVGKNYQVQIWINDSRSGASGGTASYPTRTETLSTTGGNSETVAYDVGGTSASPAGGTGQYVIGYFTANATTQVINLAAGNTVGTGSLSVQINAISVETVVTTGTATVSYNTTHQRIDGFGASSAWDSSWTTAQADLFFSTNTNGVGLSLLRSRIAPDGTSVETNIMQMAQARGAQVWSTPWSPPSAFKDSGTVNGGNFVSTNNQAYAQQIAGYVNSMWTDYGIALKAVSVQNEPDLSESYESCVWTGQQIHDYVPYLSAVLAGAGTGNTKIMLPEKSSWDFSLATTTMSDSATAGAVGILAAHNYGSTPAAVTQFGTPVPLPLWETEHYFGTDDSIQNGLALAQEIHSFLTVAQANAYHYWWLKGSGTGSLAGDSTDTPAKRLYVMGNYSKFVRPGFYRVDVTNNTLALVTAYKDPASSNFVIVAANPSQFPITQTFNLTSCPSFTSLYQWVTSATLSLSNQASVGVSGGNVTYTIPALSVVTLTTAPPPTPLIVLTTEDAAGSSSFNAIGNWDDTVAPNSGSNYTVAQYPLRTPTSSGAYTFAGKSLTLPPLGSLTFDGPAGQTITVPSLILAGGAVTIGSGSSSFTLAGNLNVSANSIIDPGSDPTHTMTISANLSGSGSLANGNGGPGTVIYSGNNSAYTGALYVNGGTVLLVASQANLGGNPATFDAAQLTLDDAVFQPTASFTMSNSNSGITLGAGGASFAVNSGLTLRVSNLSGTGSFTKTGTGTMTVSPGTNTYTGATTVSAGELIVTGNLTSSSSISIAAGATLDLSSGNFSTSGTIINNGTLVLGSGVALGSTGTFTNNGTLDLSNDPSYVLPANFVNHGTVIQDNAPVSDTPTMPTWALILTGCLLFLTAGRSLLRKPRAGSL